MPSRVMDVHEATADATPAYEVTWHDASALIWLLEGAAFVTASSPDRESD